MAGDNSGVVRVLDEELLDEEDRRLFVGESELKDDTREVGEQDRDEDESDTSDVAGLTLRCAMR
jgi:hypothetical protein